MKVLICFVSSLLIHGVPFFIGIDKDVDQGPTVFVMQGQTAITMRLIPPQAAIQQEEIREEIQIKEELPEALPEDIVVEEKKETFPEKIEEEAISSAGQKGVVTEAAMAGNTMPGYPLISRRRGEEGRGVLRIFINGKGICTKVEIVKSTGYQRLDNSAVKWAKEAQYNPAFKDGKPVASEFVRSIRFTLKKKR